MNKDILQGKWKQLTGLIESKIGEMTDDELKQIDGEIERINGSLQEKYGKTRDKAEENAA